MSSEIPFNDLLSKLIGDIYTAAMEGAGWTGIASSIAFALESTSTILKLHGPGDTVHLLECTQNLSVPNHQQSWATHWHQQDLWVERSAAFGISRIVTDQDLVSPDEQQSSGFYQEWLRALDIHHMVGAVFPGGDGLLGVLGIHRPEGAGAYTDDDRRKVAFLLPHLQRALWLSHKLSAVTARQMAAEAVLERIDAAVFVVDRIRRIVTQNAHGECQLRAAKNLANRGDCLVLTNTSLNTQLIRLVNAAISTASGRPVPVEPAIVIPRVGQLPLTLLVTPLHSQGLSAFSQPLALVVVRDPEADTLAATCLRDLFGLTRTEAVIAADLAGGLSVDKVASRRGIGTATVRSHVKCILSKTGTHRLAEAVTLITRSVAGLTQS
tara:strand:- start:1175 stop:2317 length:1143 start_codon:yes stop_codon:yes gene_type:complete